MIGNRAIEREKKADFIIKHFPNVYKLDPLFSYKEVREIRNKMIEHGLYAQKQSMELIDSSIINMIQYIQTGEKSVRKHRVQRKEKSNKHY